MFFTEVSFKWNFYSKVLYGNIDGCPPSFIYSLIPIDEIETLCPKLYEYPIEFSFQI